LGSASPDRSLTAEPPRLSYRFIGAPDFVRVRFHRKEGLIVGALLALRVEVFIYLEETIWDMLSGWNDLKWSLSSTVIR
jgi:hypothetical protein